MSGKLKMVLIAVILLLLILQIVPDFLPDVMSNADAVSDNTSYPTVLRTIFGLWWLPVILLLFPTFFSSGARQRVTRWFKRRR